MTNVLVIHVVTSLFSGGLEKIVVAGTNYRNNHFAGLTYVCCLDELGEFAGEITDNAVFCLNADRSHFPWDIDAVRKIRQQLSINSSKLLDKRITDSKEQITNISQSVILHAHNMAAWQYAVLATFGTGVKIVYTQHGVNVHNQGLKNQLRSIFLSWFTDRIVAVSENAADAMARYQGIPCHKITVIHNGVDVDEFLKTKPRTNTDKHGWKKEIGISVNSFIIGSIGRLDYVKGYDILISAFAGLVQHKDSSFKCQVSGVGPTSPVSVSPIPRFAVSPVLLLVGDGPERENLERQAKELNVDKQVIFAGYQKSVQEYLRLMDVFMLPSRSEGISIALLEACACGLPVVVTDVGGNAEVIEDGKTGIIVPSDDINALRSAISRLYADESLQSRIGDAARERIVGMFSLEKTMNEYEKIYSEEMTLQ